MPSRTSVAARDAGLRRVAWITRGAVAAGVALTGAFAAVAANAFPGRSGHRATAVVAPPADAVAPPVAETTTEPPTTEPPTTLAVRTPAAAVHRPLQPPPTVPRAVVATHVPVTAARAPVPVRRVQPHVVTGGS